ncbi:hypothetical protein EXIGLDRAFT_386674 [Exidia glandulosa HHB12029]|uniref:Uncharacterized protein n=1 Tax=Exidia glandulosa HHB12029 TaxID=1314781 RepID=A0A165L138_EXIGL|nr:hypothetical protein EXIGLDRAFT_386674 [Exidia glandulosa HHB12029]
MGTADLAYCSQPPPSGCPAGDLRLVVDVQATVLYAIPESASKPIRVRRIMSELGAISQYFNALRGDLFISFFYLMSTTGDIRVQDMATDRAYLYTDSGSIEASVSVTGPRSTLSTLTGRVKANVVLDDGVDMALEFASFGGPMDVELAISDARASKNLVCDVDVLCISAPVRLNVISLPTRTPFGLLHASWRSEFELILPSTFEGAFTFRGYGLTEDKYPKVVARPGALDPEGKGRNRTISSQSYVDDPYHVLAGETYWGSLPNTSNHLQWVYSESSAFQTVLML